MSKRFIINTEYRKTHALRHVHLEVVYLKAH